MAGSTTVRPYRALVGRVLLGLVVALVLYLAAWPVPVEPVAWSVQPSAGYVGAHAVNTRLRGLQMLPLGGEEGPEHVLSGPDGKLYVSVASGRILRLSPAGGAPEVFADTGGRTLGLDFDARGNLIAADAYKGLLSIAPDGTVSVLSDHLGADPIRYADAVVVARSGKMYFTDASMRFSPAEFGGTFAASFLDILEHSSTGRVLVYDPQDKSTRLLAGGLSFANGIALSADEQHLFVVETGNYRIWKLAVDAGALDLRQPRPADDAAARVLLDNLPGFPDNLMRGRAGRIWLGLAKPRSTAVDQLADKPALRKLLLRLPKGLWPVPPAYGHVLAFNERGEIVADMQDPAAAYPETTGVTETADRLYIQSLHAHTLAWLPQSAVSAKE